MALASAPATPERTEQPPAIRRSFTAPTKSFKTTSALSESDAQSAETLFTHASGKIIAFSASSNSARRHSSIGDTKSEFQDEPVGILPWASITERTVAAGPLQIYRVLGSVAFLNSGKILQPLLAKSQCWCVDGVSKFVLRVRPNTYYRIELPHETTQDEEKVEEVKKVMERILQYEKTPCPFKRGFTVDLPEPPETPIRKRPWRPKGPTHSSTDEADGVGEMDNITEESDTAEAAGEENVNRQQASEDLDVVPELKSRDSTYQTFSSTTLMESEETTEVDGKTHVETAVDVIHQRVAQEEEVLRELDSLRTPTRPKTLRAGRTVTAPPHLSLRTPPPPSTSGNGTAAPSIVNPNRNTSTFSSSVESFHSFHSPITPLPPSPPSPNSSASSPDTGAAGLYNAKIRHHKRDVSEVTVTENSGEPWDHIETSATEENEYHSLPDFPQLASSLQENSPPNLSQTSSSCAESTEPPRVRVRNTRKFRIRTPSPLPSSTNLYSPYSPQARFSSHNLTTAILQRTCSLLLGPPVQLVALMLRIAAKITQGVFHGTAFGMNDTGQRIPCSWDFSDGSGDDEQGATEDDETEDEEEDDYGISLGKTVSGKDVRSRDMGGSWEID